MSNIISRNYEGGEDLQIILDLIARTRPSEHLHDYPVKADLEENLAAETHANMRLWFDNNQPVAWALVDTFNNLLWELDNKYDAILGAEIVGWGQACIRKTRNGEAGALDASCREDYTARISFLQRHGFSQGETISVAMIRDLSKPISEPKLPQGFIIRPITGVQEAESVAAMHRAAFGTDYMTTGNRLAIMNTSEYDPSLDLVVIAPDDTIAANCICSVRQNVGMTDPVSTHPRFQRMGLAHALLLTGLRLLQKRGMTSARLGTSGENIAMQKTAKSVGFTMQYKTLWFSKEVN